MITEILLLQLGETMNEGTIAKWYKQEGDKVEKGEPVCAVETDKAVLDIEAPIAGYLEKITVPAGDTAPVLQVIGYITDKIGEFASASAPAAASATPAAAAPAATATAVAVEAAPVAAEAPIIKISPIARKVAKQHGVDITQLKGTGPGGRIVEADVLEFVRAQEEAAKAAPAPVAAPAAAAAVSAAPAPAAGAGDWDLLPLSKIRRITAEKLSESYRQNVHVTLHCQVDMAEASKMRKQMNQEWEAKQGVKVTFTDLLVKAVAKALVENPVVNSSFTYDGIKQYRRANVGVAMSIPTGLVVPVVRSADQMGLLDIARTVRALTEKARKGQIMPDDMQGGTFTISNMGTMGVDDFTPIINGTEGAILGVGQIRDQAVVRDGSIVASPQMALSLSFDHRLVDGAGAAVFLNRVKQILEVPFLLFA